MNKKTLLMAITLIFSFMHPSAHAEGGKVFSNLGDKEKRNTYFGVSPSNFPEVGQTFQIKKSIKMGRVQLNPTMLSVAKSLDFFTNESFSNDKVDNFSKSKKIDSTILLSIYKWQGSGKPGANVDITQGFNLINQKSFNKEIQIGKPFSMKLDKQITLDKGVYFIVFGFSFPEKRILELRLAGQENGSNTMGGYNHDKPFDCKYKKTKDKTPGFQVYRTDPGARTKSGEFPGTVGFGNNFLTHKTKITECAKLGVYGDENMIWNPGDLDMVFYSK